MTAVQSKHELGFTDHDWPELHEYLAEVEKRLVAVQGSNNLDLAIRHAVIPTGKLIRPSIMIAACDVLGQRAEPVLPAAVGIELCHVGSLVHDDIIDESKLRRGRPSVHTAFGASSALVAGDALIFRSFGAILKCAELGVDPQRISAAVEALSTAGRELCRGQAYESQIIVEQELSMSSYLSMVEGKTASLFEASVRIAAVISGADEEEQQQLAEYGRSFGVYFQLRDDMLPFLGLAAQPGKDLWSDIRNGAITLPFLTATTVLPPEEREELLTFQRRAARGDTDFDVAEVARLISTKDGLDAATRVMREHLDRGCRAIEPYAHRAGGRYLMALLTG